MAKEEIDSCSKTSKMYCYSRRSFKIHFIHQDKNDDANIKGKDFLFADRPFSLSCCCLCRPIMTVQDMEDNGRTIGKIIDVCDICNKVLEIRDANNSLLYKIESDCKQLGWWCNFPCDACETIKFDIKDSYDKDAGSLTKKPNKCFEKCLTADDKFHVKFGSEMSPVDKSLVMASVIMTDMC